MSMDAEASIEVQTHESNDSGDLIYMSGMSFSLTLSFHISEWSNIASLAHWIFFSLLNT